MPVEAADIVVRAMDDLLDGTIRQNSIEEIELFQGYGIDNVDIVAGGYLNKAELLGVVVKAVGLGIQGDGLRTSHRTDGGIELCGLGDDFDGKWYRDGHGASSFGCVPRSHPHIPDLQKPSKRTGKATCAIIKAYPAIIIPFPGDLFRKA
jgi:hypothetical protein